jgi:hypothetical protein
MGPDATKNGNEASREERINDAPFSFLDDPISDLVSEGDHDAPPGDKKDEGVKDDAPVSPALQARLDKMEESLEEHRQTAQYLKGQNSILEAQLRGDSKEEKKVEKPLLSVDKTKLQAALSDPETAVDTLTTMFEDFGRNILERVTQVQEESRGEHSRRDQHARWQTQMAQDRADAITEFGEDTLNDKDFIAEADKEMEKVIARRGGKSLADVLPGDFMSVAALVYGRRLKAGKINNEVRNGNGDTRDSRRPTLREISREVSSSDRSVSNGGPRGGGNGGAKTIADLGMSPRDTRIAQAAAKRMNVSEEAWVKNYKAGQDEDEGYGR